MGFSCSSSRLLLLSFLFEDVSSLALILLPPPYCLPLAAQPGRHMVTIKAVPRQGLSTMYCMTNVLKFQQQFLNWQILNWTRVDSQHIKIHLQVGLGFRSNRSSCSGEGTARLSLCALWLHRCHLRRA